MSSRRTVRLATAALAVTALGAGLTACGGTSSGSGGAGGAGGGAATGAANGQSSATYSPGSTVSAAQIDALMKKAASSATSAHVEMTMDMSTTGTVSASGDIAFKPTAEDLTMQVMGRKVEMRLVGQAMYMHMPGLPGGVQWMKMDLSAFGKLGMGSLSSGLTNPMSMIDQFAKSVDHATYVGHETLNGVGVDHYRITVDSKKALSAAMPSGAPSGVPSAKLPKAVTEDVFLDSAGHLDQAKVDMGSMGTTTVTMSDYGKKVDIAAPPAGQTKDMSDMLGSLGSSLGQS